MQEISKNKKITKNDIHRDFPGDAVFCGPWKADYSKSSSTFLAPAAQATVRHRTRQQHRLMLIADEAAPLAANVEEDTQETVEEPRKDQGSRKYRRRGSPLADVAVESEQAKMSWWWWLIILILGAPDMKCSRSTMRRS